MTFWLTRVLSYSSGHRINRPKSHPTYSTVRIWSLVSMDITILNFANVSPHSQLLLCPFSIIKTLKFFLLSYGFLINRWTFLAKIRFWSSRMSQADVVYRYLYSICWIPLIRLVFFFSSLFRFLFSIVLLEFSISQSI